RSDTRALGGDERSAVSEQRDHRGLSHVRRLAAHVRARDDEKAPGGREVEVVGDERLYLLSDHRMPSAANGEAGRVDEVRAGEIESLGALGERDEDVERCERGRRALS